MIKNLIAFSVRSRWLVVLLTALVVPLGVWSLMRLPIDAVPDITNNQVQINAFAPALSAFEIEKQVTYPIENAIAGIPGLEYTRSLSRNGFAQVTAVFADSVDIYFARQQVGERLTLAKETFPPGVESHMGPVATGLSEIYMWSVDYAPRARREAGAGREARLAAQWRLSDAGRAEAAQFARTTAYLRTVQDWIIQPQLRTVPESPASTRLAATSRNITFSPTRRRSIALGLSFADLARHYRTQQYQPRRGLRRTQRRGPRRAQPGRLEIDRRHRQGRRVDARRHAGATSKTSRRWASDASCAWAAPA